MTIPFVQAAHFYRGGNVPTKIIIHDMEYPERPTGAAWCANYFAGLEGMTTPQASAHYCADSGNIVQCVKDTDGAWHTPGSLSGVEINRSSIGIEHAGYARQTPEEWRDEYSTAMLEMSAGLVAGLCLQYGIPPVRLSPADLRAGAKGICGHVDCTVATGTGSHTDPGPHFPWDWYMERVLARYDMLHNPAQTPAAPLDARPGFGWVPVSLAGVDYQVAPYYVPFVGLGQAEDLAASLGCELPTPALVDAIWRQADLRIDATEMVINDHDGTPQTMASLATFERQRQTLARLIGDRALGVDYQLLAGAFKDVCHIDGQLGLYGWQRLDGSVIQGPYTKHARGWLDYSQGLRLCRRL